MTYIYRYIKSFGPNDDLASFRRRFVPYKVAAENFRSYLIHLGEVPAALDHAVFVNKVTMLRHLPGTEGYEPWFTEKSMAEVISHFGHVDLALDMLQGEDSAGACALIYHRSLMERCIEDDKIRLSSHIKRNLQNAIDLDGRQLWTLLSDFSYLDTHYYKPTPRRTEIDEFVSDSARTKSGYFRGKDKATRTRRTKAQLACAQAAA